MIYKNLKDCHLMIWETEQSKRNTNNIVKFNLLKQFEAKAGDEIHCKIDKDRNSVYKITEVLDVKDSSMSDMNYITAKTEWCIK